MGRGPDIVSVRMWVLSLASLSGLRISIAESCGTGHRCGSDLVLLWLWCRLAAAALIRLLAGELPYAEGAALKRRGAGEWLGYPAISSHPIIWGWVKHCSPG